MRAKGWAKSAIAVITGVASLYPVILAAQVEEIVVTARRVEESLQEIPGSVTAFSQDFIQAKGFTKASDIGNLVPNMEFQITPSGSQNGANIFIRGIGQNDFVATTDPGVGLYLDGVYVGRMMGSLIDMADIERVEVLRGPQGTLFGKNTIGGAVQIVTQKPNDQFSGRAEISAGRFSRIDGELAVNVPLSSNLFVRASGVYRSNEGFAERILDGQDAGDDQDAAGRMHILWEASERLTIDISGDITRRRANPASHSVLPGSAADVFIPENPRKNNANSILPFQDDLDVYGFAGTINWRGDMIEVKSITSYRDTEQFVTVDFDGSLLVLNENLVDQNAWQFSQELQFLGTLMEDRVEWLVGLYYLQENVDWTNITVNGPDPIDQSFLNNIDGPLDPNVGSLDIVDQETENYSVFAHAVVHLTDRLDLTAGFRYTDETKDAIIANPTVFQGEREVGLSFDDFTPKISLDFNATENILLYAQWAQGFRSGGVNGRLVPATLNTDTYDPETLDQFEIGMKSDLFDQRLRLNIAGFYGIFEDYQVTTLAVDQETGGFFFPIDNVGDLDVYGFEVEATYVPGPRTQMSLGLGFLEEEVTRLGDSAIPFIFSENTDLPLAPEWQVSATAQHRVPIDSGDVLSGNVVFDVDASYKSEMFQFTLPAQPNIGKDFILNAQIRLEHASERWEFAIWGKNLTDETVLNFAQDLGGFRMGIFQRPLEWGATFRVFFQ